MKELSDYHRVVMLLSTGEVVGLLRPFGSALERGATSSAIVRSGAVAIHAVDLFLNFRHLVRPLRPTISDREVETTRTDGK